MFVPKSKNYFFLSCKSITKLYRIKHNFLYKDLLLVFSSYTAFSSFFHTSPLELCYLHQVINQTNQSNSKSISSVYILIQHSDKCFPSLLHTASTTNDIPIRAIKIILFNLQRIFHTGLKSLAIKLTICCSLIQSRYLHINNQQTEINI